MVLILQMRKTKAQTPTLAKYCRLYTLNQYSVLACREHVLIAVSFAGFSFVYMDLGKNNDLLYSV